jgi:Protein of unknown function (DUF4232)
MKLTSQIARHTVGMVAIASTAILVPAVAMAASGSATTPQMAAASQSAAIGRCLTGQLRDWIGIPGDQTAGSTYYQLEISNISRSTCTLYGYPGVSAVRNALQREGSPASRTPGHAERLLTLVPGSTVHVILRIADVYNFSPSACRPVEAFGLRVYAPGAYSWQLVGMTFEACSKSGPVFLNVSTTIAGTGIPGYSH